MFLIRMAFWLAIVVMLLPADSTSKNIDVGAGQADVGAIEAIGAARAALDDLSGMCERRPAVCETGQEALQAFGQKAKYGAKRLYEYLDENVDGEARSGAALPVDPRNG